MERRGRVSAGSRQQDAQRRSTASRKKNRHLEERGLMKEASCGCTLLAELLHPPAMCCFNTACSSQTARISLQQTLWCLLAEQTPPAASCLCPLLWMRVCGGKQMVLCWSLCLVVLNPSCCSIWTRILSRPIEQCCFSLLPFSPSLLLPLSSSSCSSHPEQDIPIRCLCSSLQTQDMSCFFSTHALLLLFFLSIQDKSNRNSKTTIILFSSPNASSRAPKPSNRNRTNSPCLLPEQRRG